MTGQKQVNTENRAVLNRDFPRRGRSLIVIRKSSGNIVSRAFWVGAKGRTDERKRRSQKKRQNEKRAPSKAP